MAILTKGIFLMKGVAATGSEELTYSKLMDITSYPDLGTDPSNVDVTTLSDPMHKYIEALPDTGGTISFPGFFDNKAEFLAVKELEGENLHLAVWVGGTDNADGTITPTGDKLKVKFDGMINARLAGAGVGEAIPTNLSVTVGSPYVYE